jgi:hypothetical protein
MRFSIRDLLWLTAFVAVAIVWLMDRNAIRREQAELAKREAELTSRAKMWEAEAQRAEKRYTGLDERLGAIRWALERRNIKLNDLIDANNRPKSPRPPQKTIDIDPDSKRPPGIRNRALPLS